MHVSGVSTGVSISPVVETIIEFTIIISHRTFLGTLVFSHPSPHETVPLAVVGQVPGVPKGPMWDPPSGCVKLRVNPVSIVVVKESGFLMQRR